MQKEVWGGGSVGTVLSAQASGPESGTQKCMLWMLCGQRQDLETLTGQPS